MNEAVWEGLVEGMMANLAKTEEDVINERKGASWKVTIAVELRTKTTAGNPWIAKRLNMGHPSSVTNLMRDSRK